MGQKLGAFLRVLGAGLSPQAFAAQTQNFAAEQATERAKDLQIETIGLKQGMATASILGKAYDNETDEAKKREIIQEMKSLSDRVSGGDQRTAGAFKSAWVQGRMDTSKSKKGVEKTGIAMIDPAGNEFMGFQDDRQFKMRDKTGNLIPVPHGSIKAPTKQLTGELSKTQRGKLTLGGIEGEQNLRNNIRDIDSLIETVSSPDFLGGNLGNAVQALNSARSQATQVFGGEDYLTDDGKVNPKAFKTDSKFRKMAITGNLAESQTLELAFILAKSLNPDGKISDADVRQAGKILGDSADPKVRKKLLDNVKKRIIARYNSDQSVIARRQKKPFTPLTIEGLTGEKKEAGSAASRIMKKVGF